VKLFDGLRAWWYGAPNDGWVPSSAPNACCRELSNMTLVEKAVRVRVYRCRECHRRHYRALVTQGAVFRPGKVRVS
jgi:hypothetical protein